jgi:hypothetical protein
MELPPTCSTAETLVDYMYGELGPAERVTFEHHLEDCDLCVAELANLSFARLDVFEWRRDEFAQIPTPAIAVPLASAPVRLSWWAALQGILFPAGRLAMGGAAALVLLAAFAAVWIFQPRGDELAGRSDESPVTAPQASPPIQPTTVDDRIQARASDPEPSVSVSNPVNEKDAKPGTRALRTTAPAEQKAARTPAAQASARPAQVRKAAAAPRLNEFEDDDDRTLRLGDLLAEIDTRDRE